MGSNARSFLILGCQQEHVNLPTLWAAVSELFERVNQLARWEGSFRGGFATTSGGGLFSGEPRPAPGGLSSSAKRIGKGTGENSGEGLERVNWYRGHWELRDETRGCAVVRSRS